MSSALGFPDWQKIQQWLGAPVASQAGFAIGAGTHDDGPFNLTSWASVVVAIKATGGNVTATVKQAIKGGPAGLELDEVFVVAAGATVFQSVLLYGDAVTLELAGGAVGTVVDYALIPANTPIQAAAITNALLTVQHNEVKVGAEPIIDLVDALGFAWTIADDAAGTRVKVTPPARVFSALGSVAGASAITFSSIPATYKHLLITARLRCVGAITQDSPLIRLNNDAVGPYDTIFGQAAGAAPSAAENIGAGFMAPALMPGALAPANSYADLVLLILDYANAASRKAILGLNGWKNTDAAGSVAVRMLWGERRVAAAINRIDISGNGSLLDTASMASLYGLGA